MIYFDEPTRNEIINKYVNNLEVGGYLLIGKTESIDRKVHMNLDYIKPGIYRKREG
jgi:chemotaxis protein methyltransferase CheR